MVGIQQDILRAAGAMKKGSETRAEEEGKTVSCCGGESQWDECGGGALTSCRKKMVDVGDLELGELEEVDLECVPYHCDATMIVADEHGQQSWEVRAVHDSAAGVSCICEKMAAEIGAHFEGTRNIYPMRRTTKARVAYGRELVIKQRTRRVSATILTP